MNDNDRTLQSYQDETDKYLAGTPPIPDELKTWIDDCLNLLPKNAKILEIGSGFGMDAEYMKAQGYDIECSDAVPNFVEILKKKGLHARLLNVLKDPIEGSYDMVFADAVLLHFDQQETIQVIRKIRSALRDDGILAVRVKQGDGETWSDAKLGAPRYFHYWQSEDLQQMIVECGFETLDLSRGYSGHNKANWIGVIARKRS